MKDLKQTIKTVIRGYLNEQEKVESNLNDNFWNWFGDSKMVDEKGNPMVLYHGSSANFRVFNNRMKGSATDSGMRGRGWYLSANILTGDAYTKNRYYDAPNNIGVLYKLYAKIENPFDLHSFNSLDEIAELLNIDSSILHERGRGSNYHSIRVSGADGGLFSGIFSDAVMNHGYDGIIHYQEIVTFEPNQMKSVDNDGTWDINDNDIYS